MMQNFTALSGYEWTPFYETCPPHKWIGLRERLEAEIERLIQLLDDMDGDPDLEPYLADCEEPFQPLTLNRGEPI